MGSRLGAGVGEGVGRVLMLRIKLGYQKLDVFSNQKHFQNTIHDQSSHPK